DVHEGNGGKWIVADTATLAHQCGVAQALNGYVGKVNVRGLAVDVLALLSLSAARLLEHAVGGTRAVTGDNVDRLARAEFVVHFPGEIDQFGIHGRRLVLAPVAQNPVDPLHGRGNELAVALVRNGDRLLGVNVVEGDRAIGATVCTDRARADGGGGRADEDAGQES